ncbi:MAG: hypothetical protein Hyperionvirus22_34 [Hyperionvirus sp.]|uniref:Uncharacterized protein n=1 Tax=Hyperionvirus sp. TaxID=2487770 RepID=A0A3G5AEM4_9VIRU|nr:MAG: hypothetical protein Hyperionvirus22_34 [Hyperionvirus sp.]
MFWMEVVLVLLEVIFIVVFCGVVRYYRKKKRVVEIVISVSEGPPVGDVYHLGELDAHVSNPDVL